MFLMEGEDVKQAVVERLLERFPDIAVYKEASSTMMYPSFYVYQITVLDEEDRKDVHLVDCYMDVRYRVAGDSSTDLTLERDLDNMGLKLLQTFDIIEMEGEKVRCTEKSVSKSDGVLHFFFTIRIMARKVSASDETKQMKLTMRIGESDD